MSWMKVVGGRKMGCLAKLKEERGERDVWKFVGQLLKPRYMVGKSLEAWGLKLWWHA